jgi:DMSO/TMAO reductase YedYZ molybdopterin-dependent catalytic subunit
MESPQPPPEAVSFLKRHRRLSRRHFMAQSGGSAAALMLAAEPSPEALKALLAKLGPYLTPQASFRDVSRGKPVPHSLPPERLREAGLTRDTWRLEILPDPEHPATLGKRFSLADGTAITFDAFLEVAKKRSVRFPKLMTCLNIGCPLGMGVWEGVPLRDLVWMAGPRENLRRVHYHGYHNNDPAQMFRSSLPVGRVLEDPDGLPPVIVCHKLNGEWLTPERGAPARMVVPEHYGFKSVKWLTRVFLSNLPHANDTYAGQNNDIDSPMKTFAATLHVTENPAAWPAPGCGRCTPRCARGPTGGTLPERTLFVTYPHYLAEHGTTPVRAAIQGRYKLVWHPYDHIEIAGARVTESNLRYMPKPRVELFDLETDPGEHENVSEKHPEKVSELKSFMETWMKQAGAKDLTPNPAYDATRPLFNTRDEWLKQELEQKKAKK